MDLTQKLVGVIRTIATKVRADEDTPKSESVQVFLDIDFSDCSIEDVLTFACADRRIAWANGGSGRKAISSLTAGQHIKVRATSPGVRPQVDPETAMAAKLSAMTQAEREKYLMEKFGLKLLPTPPQIEPLK